MFHIKHSHIDNELDANKDKDNFVVDIDFDSNFDSKFVAEAQSFPLDF